MFLQNLISVSLNKIKPKERNNIVCWFKENCQNKGSNNKITLPFFSLSLLITTLLDHCPPPTVPVLYAVMLALLSAMFFSCFFFTCRPDNFAAAISWGHEAWFVAPNNEMLDHFTKCLSCSIAEPNISFPHQCQTRIVSLIPTELFRNNHCQSFCCCYLSPH